jgi:hypothetical protein
MTVTDVVPSPALMSCIKHKVKEHSMQPCLRDKHWSLIAAKDH